MTEGSIQIIRAETARFYGVSLADIEGPSRKKHIAHSRHMAMLICRKLTDKSLKDIARYFGGRDHTSVSHGIEKMRAMVGRDMDARHEFHSLRLRAACLLDERDSKLIGVEA